MIHFNPNNILLQSSRKESPRITTGNFPGTAIQLIAGLKLFDNNVTHDDEGEYTCQVTSLNDVKETSVYIRVYG